MEDENTIMNVFLRELSRRKTEYIADIYFSFLD
jgi:hypothetical protein